MWDIKKEDMVMKAKLTKMKLFDRLIAKPEPLAEGEKALKNKLINELLSNYVKSKSKLLNVVSLVQI